MLAIRSMSEIVCLSAFFAPVRSLPSTAVRMLFSVRRGLFLWTPLTALTVLGVALLFRSRPERRRYLTILCVCAASLVCIHMLWGDFWTNGFSFSQRFFTGLFPFYLLGTAEPLVQAALA